MKPVVGTGAVTLEISIRPAGPPHTYLGIANGLMPGIRLLAASPLPALPLTMLCAHALECVLKAFLSRSGDDSGVLKPNVRHNLSALWTLAHRDGLAATAEPPQWAASLSDLHAAPYYLRYSTGVHGLALPNQSEMAAGVSALLEQVRASL